MKEFFTTLQGKAIAVLTIIALLFGIGAEGASMYRNAMEGLTSQAIARESAARQEAERREKQALAEKTAAEQRTAEAIAAVSREMQAATVAAKQAEAVKLDGEATQAQFKACAYDTTKCSPEQRRIITGQTDVGGRLFALNLAVTDRLSGGTGDPLHNGILARAKPQGEAPTNAPQVPPVCRKSFANWQVKAHGVFASRDGGCAWNGSLTTINTIDEAKALLGALCQEKHWNCTIIATK